MLLAERIQLGLVDLDVLAITLRVEEHSERSGRVSTGNPY